MGTGYYISMSGKICMRIDQKIDRKVIKFDRLNMLKYAVVLL